MSSAKKTALEVEPYDHKIFGYGFMVHYGEWRALLFRSSEEDARRDGETYVRSTGRWVDE